MLMIRLQRVGRKHEPTFRVVLTDSKNSTKSGRFLELLGSYDPRKTTEVFNGERIKEWMGKGAKLSDTLHNLLVSHKIIEGKKINVLPRKSPPMKEAPVEEKAPVVPASEVSSPAEDTPSSDEAVVAIPEVEVVSVQEAIAEPSVETPLAEEKKEETSTE